MTIPLDFVDVGLFIGSGNGSHAFVAFELVNDGVVVQSGALGGHSTAFHWLSITGGGFDTIRLRDGFNSNLTVQDGTHNALAFDRVVATAVPEPSITLFGALTGAGLLLRRRRGV